MNEITPIHIDYVIRFNAIIFKSSMECKYSITHKCYVSKPTIITTPLQSEIKKKSNCFSKNYSKITNNWHRQKLIPTQPTIKQQNKNWNNSTNFLLLTWDGIQYIFTFSTGYAL